MCDYSLRNVASRPARVGDGLVTTGFINSLTRGFCASGEPGVAVCLRPGTEIAFEKEVEFDDPFAWLTLRFGVSKLKEKVARFQQVNLDRQRAHHDALEFADGKIVLVTRLCIGQRAKVLQLPAQARDSAAQYEEPERIPSTVV